MDRNARVHRILIITAGWISFSAGLYTLVFDYFMNAEQQLSYRLDAVVKGWGVLEWLGILFILCALTLVSNLAYEKYLITSPDYPAPQSAQVDNRPRMNALADYLLSPSLTSTRLTAENFPIRRVRPRRDDLGNETDFRFVATNLTGKNLTKCFVFLEELAWRKRGNWISESDVPTHKSLRWESAILDLGLLNCEVGEAINNGSTAPFVLMEQSPDYRYKDGERYIAGYSQYLVLCDKELVHQILNPGRTYRLTLRLVSSLSDGRVYIYLKESSKGVWQFDGLEWVEHKEK